MKGVTTGQLSQRGPGEIAVGVKMPPTYGKTKRPRGALLQLGIAFELLTAEHRWETLKPRFRLGGVISGIPPC